MSEILPLGVSIVDRLDLSDEIEEQYYLSIHLWDEAGRLACIMNKLS